MDIVKYTLYFFWTLSLFGLLAVLFLLYFFDVLFPDYDNMPGSIFNEDKIGLPYQAGALSSAPGLFA